MSASSSSHRASWFGMSVIVLSLVAVIPASLVASGCACKPAESAKSPTEKIGVYDSRAVAIAWVGTAEFKQTMNALKKESDQAKAAGDRERVAALEKEGAALQARLHAQGFSTAPVDDILDHYRDQLAQLRAATGAAALVSKWDEAALAKYADAERLDVTEKLVDALHPDDAQRKVALGIVTKKPIPLAQADSLSVSGR